MRIRLYAAIGNRWEGTTSNRVAEILDDLEDGESVHVHINSPGGRIFEGVGIYQVLRAYEGDVTVHVDGLAASAASVIAMAGDSVVMGEAAMLMVHNPWTIALGNADELRDVADTLDQIREAMVAAYKRATGKTEAQLRDLLDEETWMTAQEAVDQGFATEVVTDDDGEQARALATLADYDFSSHEYDIPQRLRERLTSARETMRVAAMAMTTSLRGKTMELEDDDKQTTPQSGEAEGANDVDQDAIRTQAIQAERARQNGIRQAVKAAGFDADGEFAQAMLEGDTSLDEARAKVLDRLEEQSPDPAVNATEGISVDTDERDNFRAGAQLALRARLNDVDAGEREQNRQNIYSSLSLREMARKAAEIAGANLTGLDPRGVVGAAFVPQAYGGHTTSDFPYLVEDVMHKQMLRGWEEAPETFGAWTRPGNLSDFKEAKRNGVGLFDSLDKVEEDGEVTHGSMSDYQESIQLETYAKKIRLSRKLIINDDMGALFDAPRKMGRAARRTIGDLAYAVLTENNAMSDGNNLFDSSTHNNSSSNGVSVDGLADAVERTKTHSDPDGKGNLNIMLSNLIVPAALEQDALVLLNSQLEPGGADNDVNTMRSRFELITEARLDDDSTSKWYATADPNVYDTVEIGYLNGNPNPTLEQRENYTVEGAEYMVFIDAAAASLGWRTMFRGGA